MKKLFILITLFLCSLGFFYSCVPEASPDSTPKPTAPKGLSAVHAWEIFQLSGSGGDGLYSLSASKDAKLNSQGTITDTAGYWSLTYSSIYGREYAGSRREQFVNSDNLGNYTPLSPCKWNVDSYDAVRIADANGGSEYKEIYSMTVASGNGNIFGYPGQTLWVIIYQLEEGNDRERLFLVDLNGNFIERIKFLS